MEVLYSRCAGLDVHKKTVVFCRLGVDAKGHKIKVTRRLAPRRLSCCDCRTG